MVDSPDEDPVLGTLNTRLGIMLLLAQRDLR